MSASPLAGIGQMLPPDIIGLGLLRSRQFHVKVITGIIGLVALAGLGRENQVRSFTRLAAWNQQQALRYQRKATSRPA